MSTSTENQINVTQVRKSLVIPLIVSAICQIITGIIIYALGSLALMIRYDVLYWPPFLVFTLENQALWHTIAYIIIIGSLIQIIYAVCFRFSIRISNARKYVYLFIGFQCLFIPIGTIAAVLEFHAIRSLRRSSKPEQTASELLTVLHYDTAWIQIWGGLLHEAFLTLFYLLTLYFSTVMLDLTFPYLTMGVLSRMRLVLGILMILSAGQILCGGLYIKHADNRGLQTILKFYALLQLPFLPIVTGKQIGRASCRERVYVLV